jgi:outer membrane protein assembly factor BamB
LFKEFVLATVLIRRQRCVGIFHCVLLCALECFSAGEQTGLWLLPRKDPFNTARSDVPGNFRTAPKEVWWIGADHRTRDSIRPVTIGGKSAYLVNAGTALELLRPDGSKVWQNGGLGVRGLPEVLELGTRGSVALAQVGLDLIQIDLNTGKRIWTWTAPEGTTVGGPVIWKEGNVVRLALFPKNSLSGVAFEFIQADAPPRELWRQDYTGRYWANFGPYGVVADLNNDGRQDILLAGKPSYVAALDGDTGKILFDCHYPIAGENDTGRPYGLIQATDIDGDGFRDVVVASCAVEEYVAVLKNEDGKAFRLLWSRFVERDLPKDDYELRPQTTSVADVDGDGRKELVLGLFNLTGDQRWHTVVLDAFGGWDARKLDLPDRYFWSCYDLNHDGIPEIISSEETTRRCTNTTTLHAVDGRTGKDLAVLENSSLVASARALPMRVGFFAARATPWFVVLPDGTSGLVVRFAKIGEEKLWRIEGGKSALTDFAPSAISRMAFNWSSDDRFGPLDREIKETKQLPSLAASQALVAVADGRRELIFTRGDGVVVGGTPDWQRPGALKKNWILRGTHPVVWIGPTGERIVAAFDAAADRFHLFRPAAAETETKPLVSVNLPFLPFREPGMILPFGRTNLLLYISMKSGVHTLASALFDREGHSLWRDDSEGPYPCQAGIFLGSDGQTRLAVDNHGKILFYDLAGNKRLIAHGWHDTIPGRANGAKYALPISGPFGPKGEPRIILSPGLEQLEILDEQGARVAMKPYGSIYERDSCASAVARIQTNAWALGMVTQRGVFHCADVATGQDRWALDLGVKAIYPPRVTAGDLDGDGRDNFLVGLSNGELVALDEKNGRGFVLWQTTLDAAMRETQMADLDGDGLAEIIAETDDGRIRVFRSSKDKPKR